MTQSTQDEDGGAIAQLPEFFTILADFLQLYALNDDPSILMLQSPRGERGLIGLADGKVIHAEVGNLVGEEAFQHIMCWPRGELSRRIIRRANIETIDEELSFLLMTAYDAAMAQQALEPDSEALLATTGLEDRTLVSDMSAVMHGQTSFAAIPVNDRESLRTTLTEGNASYRHYMRLVWGETLRSGLQEIEGLVSYQVVDIHTENRSLFSTGLDHRARSLSDLLIPALKQANVLDEKIELYLSHGESYHAMVTLPTGNHLIHALFSREETTPAMLQFKLKQVLDKLPQPSSKMARASSSPARKDPQ